MALIDAVVVNHNTSPFTELLIRSMGAMHDSSLDLSLTVMDNNSTDDMSDLRACAEACGVPIVQTGFVTAGQQNSHGQVLSQFVLAHPDCRYLLFLDADVCFLERGTINQMISRLEPDASLFGVGVRQSWDGENEIPETHRAMVYDRRLHPCCALIRNTELYRRIVATFGLSGIRFCHAAGEVHFWDTCELATKVMATQGLGYALCPAMVLHFFNVSYDPQWMDNKNALRNKMLQRFRPDPIEIRREDLASPAAASLILALNAELLERYPEEGSSHFRLDPGEVAEGRGAFLIAYAGGKPIGCGAIRRLDADTCEIKRMYVAPDTRGRGVGRAILAALETQSHHLGIRRIVLETGERQPEALALYTRAGFERIPAFGEYVDSPLSVCMAKTLAS